MKGGLSGKTVTRQSTSFSIQGQKRGKRHRESQWVILEKYTIETEYSRTFTGVFVMRFVCLSCPHNLKQANTHTQSNDNIIFLKELGATVKEW